MFESSLCSSPLPKRLPSLVPIVGNKGREPPKIIFLCHKILTLSPTLVISLLSFHSSIQSHQKEHKISVNFTKGEWLPLPQSRYLSFRHNFYIHLLPSNLYKINPSMIRESYLVHGIIRSKEVTLIQI